MGRPIVDLHGEVFGRLTVLEIAGYEKRGRVLWLCVCEHDNNQVIVTSRALRSGNTKSCGCLLFEHYRRNQASKLAEYAENEKFRRSGAQNPLPPTRTHTNGR